MPSVIPQDVRIAARSTAEHGLKGDDVRSLFLSAFINVTKGSNRNAA
jgi:hypothetical protein